MENNGSALALPKRYLNVDETAQYIGVAKSRVYRLVESRAIPFIRVGKATLRFDIRELDKWMARRFVPARIQVA